MNKFSSLIDSVLCLRMKTPWQSINLIFFELKWVLFYFSTAAVQLKFSSLIKFPLTHFASIRLFYLLYSGVGWVFCMFKRIKKYVYLCLHIPCHIVCIFPFQFVGAPNDDVLLFVHDTVERQHHETLVYMPFVAVPSQLIYSLYAQLFYMLSISFGHHVSDKLLIERNWKKWVKMRKNNKVEET